MVILAIAVGDIVDLFVGVFSLLLIYLPMTLGIFVEQWRNEKAAFWSSSVGFLVFWPAFFLWNPKEAFVPAVVVSIAIFVLILAIERNKAVPHR